jgi:hypothetical protein
MNLYYWLNDYMDMKDVNSVHRSWDILNNLINAENVTLYILPCLLTDAKYVMNVCTITGKRSIDICE